MGRSDVRTAIRNCGMRTGSHFAALVGTWTYVIPAAVTRWRSHGTGSFRRSITVRTPIVRSVSMPCLLGWAPRYSAPGAGSTVARFFTPGTSRPTVAQPPASRTQHRISGRSDIPDGTGGRSREFDTKPSGCANIRRSDRCSTAKPLADRAAGQHRAEHRQRRPRPRGQRGGDRDATGQLAALVGFDREAVRLVRL